ncbi:hypothetical protein F2P81_006746 [Scophthalmus maximus]|uniref:Uncharacterized protein n=1 Tax=Scophthalmus maximus TaxID=52904 RepID=A0A6A4T8Z9_SCOMX|nr:hypothetical protein F2P81_006746 [Scophthalmus maximus]
MEMKEMKGAEQRPRRKNKGEEEEERGEEERPRGREREKKREEKEDLMRSTSGYSDDRYNKIHGGYPPDKGRERERESASSVSKKMEHRRRRTPDAGRRLCRDDSGGRDSEKRERERESRL